MAQADDGAVNGPHVARHDALHRCDDVRRHQHRVNGLVRVRTVTALACHLDGDAVGSSHHGAGVQANGARAHLRPVVHSIHRLHRKTVKQTVVNHGLGAGITLFTGLKNQHRRTVKLPSFGQVAGRPDQHRCVSVVTAAMHQTLLVRTPGKVVVLCHGQGIHIGPQPHHACRVSAALSTHHGHNTRLPDAGMNFIYPTDLERLHHPRRGVHLFKPQLRVRMQVAAKSSQLGVKRGDVSERPAMGTDS